jgi:hypothetical protein
MLRRAHTHFPYRYDYRRKTLGAQTRLSRAAYG